MQLHLYSAKPEVLAAARDYVEKHPQAGACITKKEYARTGVEYTIALSDEQADALLEQLLALSPDLNIYASVFYDIEGRDSSFWGSTSYRSAIDEDGRRYYDVSSSTCWA